MEPNVEVRVSKVMDHDGETIGYLPGLFGPSRVGNSPTYYHPALRECIGGETVFETAEEAMKVWESGQPVEPSAELVRSAPKLILMHIQRDGLYRSGRNGAHNGQI